MYKDDLCPNREGEWGRKPLFWMNLQKREGFLQDFARIHVLFFLPGYHKMNLELGQHRTMGAAGLSGSFVPIVQYEKRGIHPVFPHFPYFRLGQNLSLNLLAPLCGVALDIISACPAF